MFFKPPSPPRFPPCLCSVQLRFARERIDVEALTMLGKDDLAALGVTRVGDQVLDPKP